MSLDPTGTVARVMAVLSVMAEAEGDISITELSGKLELPPSTCHRLLDLLCDGGFVARNAKLRRYCVGPTLHRIGHLVTSRGSLVDLARPIMERLTAASGETSVLTRFDPTANAVYFAAIVDAPHPMRYRIKLFEPVSAAWGASGRAVAAWLKPEQIRALYDGDARSPTRSRAWPSLEFFEHELVEIRTRGYALSHGEKLMGAVGVAAPIFGVGDAVLGSMCVTIPEHRFKDAPLEKTADLVRQAASEFSKLVGYLPAVKGQK